MFLFAVHFFLCNIYIAGVICFFLCLKFFLRKYISVRTQYNLWFLLLALMPVPFIPIRLPGIWQVFQFLGSLNHWRETDANAIGKLDPSLSLGNTTGWTGEFAVSVSRDVADIFGFLFGSVWIIGIVAMVLLTLRSIMRLIHIEKSALPLQNEQVFSLFQKCKSTLHIDRDIPIYSTAFLKSPITAGILHPRIYIPIHLISDFQENDMRFILLHELQHYRYRDAIPNLLMNIASIIYWFNPFVWYALREMRTEREIACDSSVLQILTEDECTLTFICSISIPS